MKVTYKSLTRLGLATTLFGAVACGGESTPPRQGEPSAVGSSHEGEGEGEGAHQAGEGEGAHQAGEGEGGEGEGGSHAGHDMGSLPVEKRVAFMSGHVEAGLALYRAGAPDQAAKHLLHPVSETHAAERKGIDALGFDAAIFETVSAALEAGKPATELEPQLAAAEANMALLQKNAGGDARAIIEYLMATVVEEYGVGVTDGAITDPGEYQDAFGFSVVALKTAARLEGKAAESVRAELQTLIGLWPEGGPLADSTPKSVSEVTAQTSKVLLALSAL